MPPTAFWLEAVGAIFTDWRKGVLREGVVDFGEFVRAGWKFEVNLRHE